MKIAIPKNAKIIIETLHSAGYEAYIVGGCVRDVCMGRKPHDWDVTTSATPAEIKECFLKTIDTGIAHGTVTVRLGGESYEVTTYRIDGEYEDGRHPKDVTFTSSLTEDLKRRDFTINAMAYNEKDGLVDLFGGMEDIQKNEIRCVGDPRERFSEDALRMLRALRFSAELGFRIEDETYEAIRDQADTLEKISAERIREELLKLICSDHPEVMTQLYESGLSKIFFAEWDDMMECPQNSKHHIYDVGTHTICVMQNVPKTPVFRLAALLHDVAKPVCKKTDPKGADHFVGHPMVGADMAKEILHRWKLDNATTEDVVRLVRYHDERPPMTARNVRRLMHRIGAEHIQELAVLQKADVAGQSDYKQDEKHQRIEDLLRLFSEIRENDEATAIRDLKVSGKDIMDAGIPSGPKVGEILKGLLQEVIEDPGKNDREYLLRRISEACGRERQV